MQKKNESGRSLVEMVGVLALMGLITAAAFVVLQSGLGSQKRSRASDEIDIIASNVRAMVAQGDESKPFKSLPELNGGACGAENYEDAKSLAQALLKSEKGATPFDKSSWYAVGSVDGTTFSVVLGGIPSDECQSVGSKAYSHGTGQCCEGGKIAVITFDE